MNRTERKGILILSLLSVLFLFFFYGKIILNPNEHLFVDSGDGLKSYYVYQYHIVNDTSYTQTKSINYPYGESHVFTDGQIFFADAFKIIQSVVPGISDYSIGFLNELMIFSYFFCFILLFLILRKLRLPVYFSILGALSIGILSPQIFRMVSHISLAYCFFVPLVWYLYIKFQESEKKWKYTSLLILTLSISPFVHGYYLLIGALFILCLWVVTLLQNISKIKTEKIQWVHFAMQVFIPLIIFETYMHFFDHHSDRATEPFGLFYFTANFSTIFIPNTEPFSILVNYIYHFQYQQWEGWAYVGVPMFFIFLYSLFKICRYLFRKKVRPIVKPVLPEILQPAIWAAVLVLLYSFGYPYKAHMKFLLDWFPFLKQFRALGRFAWVFYYVFTVYGMYVFYLMIRRLRQKKIRITTWVLQFLFFFVLFFEGYTYHQRVTSLLGTSPNPFQFLELSDELKESIHAVDAEKFQAILPLPFYHVGSEAQTREWTDKSIRESMAIAYHLNMPMIASSCARTSQTEAANIFQLLSPTTFRKEAQKSFRNRKPVLIIYSKEALQGDEADVLSRSIKIFSNNETELYELPYDSLFYYSGEKELTQFEKDRPLFQNKNGFLLKDSTQFIFQNSFEENTSEKTFSGKGSVHGKMKDYNFLLKETILGMDTAQYYEASFWYYNRGILINNNMLIVQEKTPDDKSAEIIASQNIIGCSNIVGDWSLIKIVFKLKQKGDKLSILLKGDDSLETPIYADDLLIRPATEDVYKILEEKNGSAVKLLKNNLIID